MRLPSLRHILVCNLILAMWISSNGLSLVAVQATGELGLATRLGEADFPCAGHGCGCDSAEMCRNDCCCDLPAPQPEPEPESDSCCSEDEASQPRPTSCPMDPPAETADEEQPATGVRLVVRSPQCAGLEAWLLAKSVNLHLPSPSEALTTWPRMQRYCVGANDLWASRSFAPDPPPPRPPA